MWHHRLQSVDFGSTLGTFRAGRAEPELAHKILSHYNNNQRDGWGCSVIQPSRNDSSILTGTWSVCGGFDGDFTVTRVNLIPPLVSSVVISLFYICTPDFPGGLQGRTVKAIVLCLQHDGAQTVPQWEVWGILQKKKKPSVLFINSRGARNHLKMSSNSLNHPEACCSFSLTQFVL